MPFAIFLLALALAACTTERAQEPAQDQAKQADSAKQAEKTRLPDFRLKDVNGREVSSNEFAGAVLIVNYWATWCRPCEKEMPGLQQIADRYVEKGVRVVGIAMDADPQPVREMARRLSIRYPLLMGNEEIQQKFGILGIPSTFLVDRTGAIRKTIIGFEKRETVEEYLDEILR